VGLSGRVKIEHECFCDNNVLPFGSMFHIGLKLSVSSHPQVNESDGDEQYFGEYALDFMAGERKNRGPKHPFSGSSSCCSSK
jgi:hypothetical protein